MPNLVFCDLAFDPPSLPGPLPLGQLEEARLIGDGADEADATSGDPEIVEIVGQSGNNDVQFVCRRDGTGPITASVGVDCTAVLDVECQGEDGTGGTGGGTGGNGGSGAPPGETVDPVDDCEMNSAMASCNAITDVVRVLAQCVDFVFSASNVNSAAAPKGLPGDAPFAFVSIETAGGVSNQLPDDGSVFRTGCTMFGAETSETLSFRCIARNGGPWVDEFPPELNDGTELSVGDGEGCTVVDGALRMAISETKIPFTPVEAGCSTAVSNGPGTTINDFVERFPFGPGCSSP